MPPTPVAQLITRTARERPLFRRLNSALGQGGATRNVCVKSVEDIAARQNARLGTTMKSLSNQPLGAAPDFQPSATSDAPLSV